MNKIDLLVEIESLKKNLDALNRNVAFAKNPNIKVYLLEERLIKKEIQELEQKIMAFAAYKSSSN